MRKQCEREEGVNFRCEVRRTKKQHNIRVQIVFKSCSDEETLIY